GAPYSFQSTSAARAKEASINPSVQAAMIVLMTHLEYPIQGISHLDPSIPLHVAVPDGFRRAINKIGWSARRWLLLRDPPRGLFDARRAIQLFDDAPQLIDRNLRCLSLIEDVLDLAKSEAKGRVIGPLQCLSDVVLSNDNVHAKYSSFVRQVSYRSIFA